MIALPITVRFTSFWLAFLRSPFKVVTSFWRLTFSRFLVSIIPFKFFSARTCRLITFSLEAMILSLAPRFAINKFEFILQTLSSAFAESPLITSLASSLATLFGIVTVLSFVVLFVTVCEKTVKLSSIIIADRINFFIVHFH